jgi:hypothetical protein
MLVLLMKISVEQNDFMMKQVKRKSTVIDIDDSLVVASCGAFGAPPEGLKAKRTRK